MYIICVIACVRTEIVMGQLLIEDLIFSFHTDDNHSAMMHLKGECTFFKDSKLMS